MGLVKEENRIMNKEIFSFVIYMIHACADRWKQNPSEVYKKMKSTNCIADFLVPNYEILHTQGTQYIVEDIKEYFHVRGVSV